jgi:hypothetical protein
MEDIYQEMLAWPLNEQAKYIRGFVDGEGGPRFYRWRNERKGHHVPGDPHVRAITVSNADRRLLNTIQLMLKNLGIRSRIYLDVRKGQRKATMDSWVLKILDKESLTSFARAIGFSNPQKNDCSPADNRLLSVTRKLNRAPFPVVVWSSATRTRESWQPHLKLVFKFGGELPKIYN